MIISWDSSALVKLLRDEPGHDLVARLWHSEVPAVASTLVVAEVAAALVRAHGDGGLTTAAYALAVRRSRQLLEEVELVAVTAVLAQRAAALVPTAQLRGADAVHLATALHVADHGVEVVLATWDRRLHAAAVGAGLGVAPAEL